MMQIQWFGPTTLTEITLLMIAFALSALIGWERHRKLKSAGMRTHALVGVGSAVFTLVSAYGFSEVTGGAVAMDPSRIAAQIVSGVGFLGAGLIFVRQNAVSGLTTAASIWATAAVGMACGAGSPTLAVVATVVQLVAVTLLGRRRGGRRGGEHHHLVVLRYRPGRGALAKALSLAGGQEAPAVVVESRLLERDGRPQRWEATVYVDARRARMDRLLADFADVPGIKRVTLVDEHAT